MISSSAKILVVDDDCALIEAAEAALAPPHKIFAAQRGAQALEILAHHDLDLVLLDYVLPDGSGLEFLRVMRQTAPALPVMLMTGFGSEDVAVASFRSGVRDYLKKPFTALELLESVERALRADPERGLRDDLGKESSTRRDSGEAPRVPTQSVQRAIAFVEKRLGSSMPLDEVARESGMSKFHFCRVFKAVTGLTFRGFVTRRRIARAVELLRDSDRSLTDVCLDVGFKDVSHFGRVFRKVTGELPSQFRRGVPNPSGSVGID